MLLKNGNQPNLNQIEILLFIFIVNFIYQKIFLFFLLYVIFVKVYQYFFFKDS